MIIYSGKILQLTDFTKQFLITAKVHRWLVHWVACVCDD